MILSKEDEAQFIKLMLSLQIYVNRKKELVPEIDTVQDYLDESMEKKQKIRNVLFNNPGLIDQYKGENPDKLTAEELEIIGKWKEFVKGEFFIERYLKEHAIFIKKNKVYAVLGISNSFEDFFDKTQLPVFLGTVLLPFKGKIIYDGMFNPYSVYFGGNTKADLKETYLRAKQRNEIITSFDKNVDQTEPKPVIAYDFKPELEEILKKIQALEKVKGQPVTYGPALKLIKAGINFTLSLPDVSDDPQILIKGLRKTERAVRNLENTIYRM